MMKLVIELTRATETDECDTETRMVTEGQKVWFYVGERLIDGVEGVARMFGRFELLARLPAVRCPGSEVYTCRPPTTEARDRLRELPERIWMEVDGGLWLTHDGTNLLLSARHVAGCLGA